MQENTDLADKLSKFSDENIKLKQELKTANEVIKNQEAKMKFLAEKIKQHERTIESK